MAHHHNENSNMASSDAILARLDEEIAHYAEITRTLRTRRNTMALIARLPDEMLARIFLSLMTSSPQGAVMTSIDGNWMPVLAVCRHWREVAINCSSLWTNIELRRSKFCELQLVRSKQASLKFLLLTTPGDMASFQAVADQLYRVEAVFMSLDEDQFPELIEYLQSPASRLQAAVFSAYLEDMSWALFPSRPSPPRLPSNIFGLDAPNLGQLFLSGCTVSRDVIQHFPRLTDLALRELPASHRVSVTETLELLKVCPELERLQLVNVLPADVSSDPPTGDVVDLPRIRELEIGETRGREESWSLLRCGRISQHLRIPSKASFICHHLLPTGSLGDSASVKTAITSLAPPALRSHPACYKARITTEEKNVPGMVGIHLKYDTMVSTETNKSMTITLYHEGCDPRRGSHGITKDEIGRSLLEIWDCSSMVELTVDHLDLGDLFWVDILPRCDHLQVLSFGPHDPQATPWYCFGRWMRDLCPRLPELKKLVLVGMKLAYLPHELDSEEEIIEDDDGPEKAHGGQGEGKEEELFDNDDEEEGDEQEQEDEEEEEEDWWPDATHEWGMLAEYLLGRKRKKKELEELHIQHCWGLRLEDAEVLEKTVGKLVWDEIESEEEEKDEL